MKKCWKMMKRITQQNRAKPTLECIRNRLNSVKVYGKIKNKRKIANQ